MKLKLIILLSLVLGVSAVIISVREYSYVFTHHVKGEVVGIDRVTQPTSIVGVGQVPDAQLFSFAVAIRKENGEIMTSSSEDRQWAVVAKGQCVEAKFFPYPPWHLEKSGTFFGARLLRIFDCPK